MPERDTSKREYQAPEITEWGTVAELTAAAGGDAAQGSNGGGIPG